MSFPRYIYPTLRLTSNIDRTCLRHCSGSLTASVQLSPGGGSPLGVRPAGVLQTDTRFPVWGPSAVLVGSVESARPRSVAILTYIPAHSGVELAAQSVSTGFFSGQQFNFLDALLQCRSYTGLALSWWWPGNTSFGRLPGPTGPDPE